MTKASSCFICGQQFDFEELSDHERSCLQDIQSNDVQYTRGNITRDTSKQSSIIQSESLSSDCVANNDSHDKKYRRCYICGSDVPVYLNDIHDKTCKKNWECGLLNIDRKTNVRSDMFRSLSGGRAMVVNLQRTKAGKAQKTNTRNHRRSSSCDDLLSRNEQCLADPNLQQISLSSTNVSSLHDDSETVGMKSHFDKLATVDSPPSSSSNDLIPDCSNSKAKSMQELREKDHESRIAISPVSSPKMKRREVSNKRQYVACYICAKLYSQHSIVIHLKQCEKARAVQKRLGTDHKVKSNSLIDLRNGRVHNNSKQSAGRSLKGTPAIRVTSTNQAFSNTARSSMDNLTFVDVDDSSKGRKTSAQNASNCEKGACKESDQSSISSAGLVKCYTCGQLFTTRSLTIHQKQCYTRQERSRDHEAKLTRKK